MFCVDEALPVTTWTLTSRRAPVMPTGAPMPSCSSTTKSCGSTWRISRPLGSATALAASIARRTSSRVISRFLPGDRDDAAAVERLDVRARQPEVHRVDLDARPSAPPRRWRVLIDSTAASRLTTTPRRMPFESARPMPMMSSPPSSVISPTMAAIFDVPTSSPTRYRSLRATLGLPSRPPSAHAAPRPRGVSAGRRPGARTRAPRTACPRSRCPARARAAQARDRRYALEPLEEPLLAQVQQRRVVVEQHDRVVRVAHVDLRDPLRQVVAFGATASMTPRGQVRAALVDRRLARRRRPHEPIDDRQVESAYSRSELVDDACRARSTRYSRRRAGRAPSAAAPRRRPRPWTAGPGAARHRRPTATRAAAAGSAARSTVRMFEPRSPSTIACTSPLDSRTLPCTLMRLTRSTEACRRGSCARNPA